MWRCILWMLADSENDFNEFWKRNGIQKLVNSGILIDRKNPICKNNRIYEVLSFQIWNADAMRELFSEICHYNEEQTRKWPVLEMGA